MTVSVTRTKNTYNGDGTISVFAYQFKIISADELTVLTRLDSTGVETTETLNTSYIVDGVNNASGGNVTFKFNTGTPTDPNYSTTDYRPQAGETVVIKRVLPLTQITDYTPNDPFPAEVHEAALDKLTNINQQQQEEIDRSFKFAETDAGTASIPTSTQRASKYLGFDASGDVVAVEGTSSDIIVSTYGATLVDDADASTARTTLGLGSVATLSSIPTANITDDAVTAAKLNISGNGVSGQYVTSDGDGSFSYTTPPAFAGRLINIQSFTASGTYTPNANALQSIVYVQAAGGGGGGTDSDSDDAQGGIGSGGNGGGYIQSAFIDVSAGSYSSTITIGAAGGGGVGVNGSAGGDSVYNDGTISLTSKGGAGGIAVTDKTSPDIAQAADSEANTASGHTPILNIGSNPGDNGVLMEATGGSNFGSGGKGADSFFGYGGRGGKARDTSPTTAYSGGDGVGYGSGGGGSATRGAINGDDFPGGDGTAGIIIIYEYT